MERLQDDDRLTTVDVAVGMALARNADHDTLKAWPSQATIADRAKCADSTARESLRRLGSLGVISAVRKQISERRARCSYTFNEAWLSEGLPPATGDSYRRLPAGISTSTSDHVQGGAPPSALPPPDPEPQPDSEPEGSLPSGPTCSTVPAREPDTSSPLDGGRTLNRCDCGHQWPAEFGPVCYQCSPIAVDREEWTCDCNGDRSWPKSRGSVCVKCGEDAAPAVGSFGADCGTAAEREQAIAEARATGKAEGRQAARQQFAEAAPEPLIPVTVAGLRARAAVLPTTTKVKPVLAKEVSVPEPEVFDVDRAIERASRNARNARTRRRA